MTRMTRPDCAVMCNLINTHTHTHTHTHYIVFCFVWYPCMAIHINKCTTVERWASPRHFILLIQCYYHRRTRLNTIKRFLSLQPTMIPHLNVLTFFPLIGGCSEGLWTRSDFSLKKMGVLLKKYKFQVRQSKSRAFCLFFFLFFFHNVYPFWVVSL